MVNATESKQISADARPEPEDLQPEPNPDTFADAAGLKSGHLITPDGERVWNVEGFHTNGDLACTQLHRGSSWGINRVPDNIGNYAPLVHTNRLGIRHRHRHFQQVRGVDHYRLGEVKSPASWDMHEIAATAVRRGGFATFTLPNGWTKTSLTTEDGSVMIPTDWFSFTGYTLEMPDGTMATVVDWWSSERTIDVKVGTKKLTVDEWEVYSSWKWGGISTEEKSLISKLGPPRRATTSTAQWLYRMFNDRGDLLYVGISDNALRRWKEHERDKPWFDQAVSFTREMHPDRGSVEEAERQAIRSEQPRYNVTYNSRGLAA